MGSLLSPNPLLNSGERRTLECLEEKRMLLCHTVVDLKFLSFSPPDGMCAGMLVRDRMIDIMHFLPRFKRVVGFAGMFLQEGSS